MAQDVRVVADKLVRFLGVIMDPQADPLQREEAYKKCEKFKKHSHLCCQVGLLLCGKGLPSRVRHFGLQLIEHCIKFRWNNMHKDEKVFIKHKALELLASGTHPVVMEQEYIKDALSHIIVEMMKREWPQQWPCLQELYRICSPGETQMELVLLIFLRLAEDIVILQNVQNYYRRLEMHQALTSSLKDLFPFFLCTLNNQYTQYTLHKQGREDICKEQMLTHGRVAGVALQTIAGFVAWAPMRYITGENNLVLRMLCILLNDSLFRITAVDCLLQLVGRKGSIEERKSMLILFEAETMSEITSAASLPTALPLEEKHYLFLKKLCQVLTGLGFQLYTLIGSVADVEEPCTFSLYLDIILAFSKHPSHVLSCYTQSLWQTLCQDRHISTSQSFKKILPKIVRIAAAKLLWMGLPSQNNSVSCVFSRFDFDNDEDFLHFYYKFRSDVSEVLKTATDLQPELCIRFATQWLQSLLQTVENPKGDIQSGISTWKLEWDTLQKVFQTISQCLCRNSMPLIPEGIKILEVLLGVETKDPTVISSLLSCISSFLDLLVMDARLLPKILSKVFASVVFSLPGETKSKCSKETNNVRKEAGLFLTRICEQYSQIILPAFDHIYNQTKAICADPEQLSHTDKCTLYEALILISNGMCDYEKQCNFLGEITAPILQVWNSEEIEMAFSSVEAFIAHFGLDCAPPPPGLDDACEANRSLIMYCALMSLTIVKTAAYTPNATAAGKGGFSYPQRGNTSDNFVPNPASPHIIPLLNGFFSLLRILNMLYIPEVHSRINPGYASVTNIAESGKNNILGMIHIDENFQETIKRTQDFITTLQETCYRVLGNAAQHLGLDFYMVPGLPNFMAYAFSALNYLPDFRFRHLNSDFIKSFLQFCPSSYYNVAIAVLEVLCPLMYQRLSARWENLKHIYRSRVGYEDKMTESLEISEDQLYRQLTREYIEVLATVLVYKKVGDRSPYRQELTELGQLILKTDSLCPTIIMTVFSCIHWLDRSASLKSLFLCPCILNQLIKDSMISKKSEAVYLLRSVIIGLQELGRHEPNQSLLVSIGLLIYESLRPRFPGIGKTLKGLTGCKQKDIQKFDAVLKQHADGETVVAKKKKRNMFKNIVSKITGGSRRLF